MRSSFTIGRKQLIQVKARHFVPSDESEPFQSKSSLPCFPSLRAKTCACPSRAAQTCSKHDGAQNTPLWQLAIEYERARGSFTEREVIDKMIAIVRILRKSIASGIAGTSYEDRVLHHQSGRFAEMMNAGRLLDGGALNRIILYVTALMEVKSSMGVIVAAPTAGACAALPGAVIAMAESMNQRRRRNGQGDARRRFDRRFHRHTLDLRGGSRRLSG
jgi:L-serine dehydratase